jgi:hypothetical protein
VIAVDDVQVRQHQIPVFGNKLAIDEAADIPCIGQSEARHAFRRQRRIRHCRKELKLMGGGGSNNASQPAWILALANSK